MSNASYTSHLKPLIPLKYCSIARAAKILECKSVDIKHWLSGGEIGAHIWINECDNFLSVWCKYDDALKLEKSLLPNEIINTHVGFFTISHVEIGELSTPTSGEPFFSFDTATRLGLISGNQNPDFNIDEIVCLRIYGQASGLWKIEHRFVPEILDDHGESAGNTILPVILGVEPDSPLYGAWLTTYVDWEDLSIDNIHIIHKDMKLLHEHISSGELMNSVLYSPPIKLETKTTNERKPRKKPQQSDLIVALIEAHPELGASVLDKPYKALEILSALFSTKGIDFPKVEPKSVGDWIKDSSSLK